MRALCCTAVLLCVAPVRAQSPHPIPAPEPPRPFERGSMNLGFSLGIASGHGTSVSLGAGYGYFVLAGLQPGLDVEVTFGSDRPTVTSLLPYLRWVVWRSWILSPYLKAQGGHWFIAGYPDLSPVGGGGGLTFFLTRLAAVQLEALVFRLFPSDACPEDGCVATSFGVSLGFFFGGPRPAAPPPPPPPPPLPEPPRRSTEPPPSSSPATRAVPPRQRRGEDEPGIER